MQCALCRENRTLCNSHIVPDFLFSNLKKKDGYFFAFRGTKNGDSNEFRKFHRTFAEKLLCSDCETLFSKWESYASLFFTDKVPLKGYAKGEYLVLDGADYRKMKLFFMSLLWRFGVSNNPWMKGCDLGPHSEKLRLLLLDSEPAEPWRYGCTITAVLVGKVHQPDLIVPPSRCRVDGHWFVRLVVGGFLLSYLVTSHKPRAEREALVMQENGAFLLSRFELPKIPFLAELAAVVSKANVDDD
jgi:hypothetical protein